MNYYRHSWILAIYQRFFWFAAFRATSQTCVQIYWVCFYHREKPISPLFIGSTKSNHNRKFNGGGGYVKAFLDADLPFDVPDTILSRFRRFLRGYCNLYETLTLVFRMDRKFILVFVLLVCMSVSTYWPLEFTILIGGTARCVMRSLTFFSDL